jgi:hypothetical protein
MSTTLLSLLPRRLPSALGTVLDGQRITLQIVDHAGNTAQACRLANGVQYAMWICVRTGAQRPQYMTVHREALRAILRSGARITARV